MLLPLLWHAQAETERPVRGREREGLMKKNTLVSTVLCLVISLFLTGGVQAGDKGRHGHEDRGGNRTHARCSNGGFIADAGNADYAGACGSCHVPYRADLLPKASWEALLQGMDDHFGQAVALEEPQKAALATYLGDHAADSGKTRLGGKIMSSLGNAVPMRLSEVPLIIREHHGNIAGKSCADCHK